MATVDDGLLTAIQEAVSRIGAYIDQPLAVYGARGRMAAIVLLAFFALFV